MGPFHDGVHRLGFIITVGWRLRRVATKMESCWDCPFAAPGAFASPRGDMNHRQQISRPQWQGHGLGVRRENVCSVLVHRMLRGGVQADHGGMESTAMAS